MSYSGSYEFKNVQVIRLIEDAYRIAYNIPSPTPSTMSADDLISATFTLNIILVSWTNRGINLWAVDRNRLLALSPNQVEYDLDDNIVDILEVSTRAFTRLLGGTAFANEGVAPNAFDADSTTGCVQTNPNGYIGYDYGTNNNQTVPMFGISSGVDRSYTLNVQWSLDDITWETFLAIPLTPFLTNKVQWFNVKAPGYGRYFRIIETGGAVLNIREIYFNGQISDIPVIAESRSNYNTYPDKYVSARPSIYVFNKQLPTPSITIWPSADTSYPALLYNCVLQIQDIGTLSNTAFVPSSFYMALRDGLAYELSLKAGTSTSDSKTMILKANYDVSFNKAAMENTEKEVDLSFEMNMTGYFI